MELRREYSVYWMDFYTECPKAEADVSKDGEHFKRDTLVEVLERRVHDWDSHNDWETFTFSHFGEAIDFLHDCRFIKKKSIHV